MFKKRARPKKWKDRVPFTESPNSANTHWILLHEKKDGRSCVANKDLSYIAQPISQPGKIIVLERTCCEAE